MFRAFNVYGIISVVPLFIWALICVFVNASVDLTRQDWALDSIRISFEWLPILEYLIPATLLLLGAMLINYLFQENEFTKSRDSYTGAFFILISSLVPKTTLLSWHYAFVLGTILALYFLFKMYRKVEKAHLVFNLAFCCGLMLLLKIELWPLAALFFISIWQVSFVKLRDALLFFFSLSLPFYLKWIFISFDHTPVAFSELVPLLDYAFNWDSFSYFLPVWLFIVLSLIFYVIRLDTTQRGMKIGAKKFSTVIFTCLLTVIILCLITSGFMPKTLALAAPLLSIQFALLANLKKPRHNRVFAILLGLIPIFYLYF